MGNSTISLQKILDRVVAKGIPTPLSAPAGYSVDLAVAMANDVMSEILSDRFNWKWNRANAPAFYTNSFQQDYPLPGLTNIAWLEDADRVDINNTSLPKPIDQLTCRRQLSRASRPWTAIREICWMYNSQFSFGTWPGANVKYSPLITNTVAQNPIMNMIDKNGNLLIVTGFGTTGSVAPFLAANALEGTTVTDGTVTWTVVAGNSQGFRVFPLPGGTGPIYQVTPYYQMKSPTLTGLSSLLNPIPDDYSNVFQRGMDSYCLMASPNPGDAQRGQNAHNEWLRAMAMAAKQGDREADAYAMLPESSPVDSVYGWIRNPRDPSQPY